MNALVFLDKDSNSNLQDDLKMKIEKLLKAIGYLFEFVPVGKNDVILCSGCFKCFTENNDVCVSKDLMSDVNKRIKDFEIIFYVGRIVFGQYSLPIKNVIDKGQIIHISRLGRIPLFIAIGYGDDVNEEEKNTFLDIFRKHRGVADIVHPLLKSRAEVFVTSSADENIEIVNAVGHII
jgi:multimeric flavodoxin WrbA